MVRLVSYFRICLYMVDSTKRPASVGFGQTRPIEISFLKMVLVLWAVTENFVVAKSCLRTKFSMGSRFCPRINFRICPTHMGYANTGSMEQTFWDKIFRQPLF